MDIIIQSLGFKAGEALESFIREKVGALKSDKIVRANVALFLGPDSDPENKHCEIRLEVPGNDHFVKKSGVHFETAASDCIDVLTAMIKKAKEKEIAARHLDIDPIELLAADGDSKTVETSK